MTGLLSAWVVIGIYIDVYWHINDPSGVESFFTPWHALFYSGFTVTTVWMLSLLSRQRHRHPGLASRVPVGYGIGLVGAAGFCLGGVADLVWHTLLGVETGFEALLSPPHLILFLSGVLIATSPLRAAWTRSSDRAPSFRGFAPQLLSIVVTTQAVAFTGLGVAALHNRTPIIPSSVVVAAPNYHFNNASDLIGVANILGATILLFLPILFLLKRWIPPFGVCATLFTSVAAFQLALYRFNLWPVLLAMLIGGLATDWLIRRLEPSHTRPERVWLFSVIAPIGLWSAYFISLASVFGVVWPPTLVLGSIVAAGLLGLALGMLAVPPPVPATDGMGP